MRAETISFSLLSTPLYITQYLTYSKYSMGACWMNVFEWKTKVQRHWRTWPRPVRQITGSLLGPCCQRCSIQNLHSIPSVPLCQNPILWTVVYTTCSKVDLKGSPPMEQPGFWGGQMVTPSPKSDGCLWLDSYVVLEGFYQNNPESFHRRPSLSGHPQGQQPCEFLFGRWRCHQAACLRMRCALAVIIQ